MPEASIYSPNGAPNPIQMPLSFCHLETPFLTQIKLNGAYTIPKLDVLVSATFQSIPGPPVRADSTVTERAPGVPLVNASQDTALQPWNFAGFLTVLGSEYGERLNQMDFRIGKIFRVGKTKTVVNLDLYNIFNRSAVTAENNNLTAFRQPTDVMLARFIKIGAQFDF